VSIHVAHFGQLAIAMDGEGRFVAVGVFAGDGAVWLPARAQPATSELKSSRICGYGIGQMTEQWRQSVEKMRRERALKLYGRDPMEEQ
jgi:hypothetical protein